MDQHCTETGRYWWHTGMYMKTEREVCGEKVMEFKNMELTAITVINQMCCSHTVSSSVCASHPNSSHTPLKTWNLCRQLNLLTFATPLPLPTRSGTPVERGSDTATEGKGRLRRCISNAREQDGWWRLQWKQHVFTSQRIPNSLFSPCTTNLSHSVQLLPKAGSNYCPELLSLVWLLLSPLKPQRRLFMFCFSVF